MTAESVTPTDGKSLNAPGEGLATAFGDHSNSSASSAATTPIPPTKRPYRRTRRVAYPSQSFKNEVAALRAEGLTRQKTAKLMEVSPATIRNIEKMPDVAQRIQQLREHWQQVAHEKLNTVAEQAWEMAGEAASQRDAKSFNATAFGLMALEKVSASVAGVGQKVEVSGIPDRPHIEIKALVQALFGR